MKTNLILLSLISCIASTSTLSCGQPTSESFTPFATIIKDISNKGMNVYEINFPMKDVKKEDFFLSSITVKANDVFVINVSYRKTIKYLGDFYTAYLTLNPSLEDKVEINADYNAGDKEGKLISLCINTKEYKLSALLNAPALEIRKEYQAHLHQKEQMRKKRNKAKRKDDSTSEHP
ncbi:hypothetical protein [Pleionea sp. CnH1-48]|uniref:hypothetical protein n=1 Tax=Pleionea sp. CnH1-48 TaxID=2954494 RepID=UPI0020971257|nr:hypothetical protein [Pleionea sp. CnH1-48]MCO7224240.1 hypothetical protein [Pleionea sp. CnH1-48]